MPARTILIASAAAIALTACRQEAESDNVAQIGNTAGAGPIEEAPAVPLADAAGTIIGEVKGGDGGTGAVFQVTARGLSPGVHGMHLHDVGVCEGPSFESAGPHWNPTNARHGLQNPQGPHWGDLPNITVGPDGRFVGNVTIEGSYLKASRLKGASGGRPILDANGVALVIHAQPDDNRTDPAGNSGARIACAAILG
jgi:superoxide dismutase, Cu-Zn family